MTVNGRPMMYKLSLSILAGLLSIVVGCAPDNSYPVALSVYLVAESEALPDAEHADTSSAGDHTIRWLPLTDDCFLTLDPPVKALVQQVGEGSKIPVERTCWIEPDDIRHALPALSVLGEPAANIVLTEAAASRLERLSQGHVGRYVAIVHRSSVVRVLRINQGTRTLTIEKACLADPADEEKAPR
jgi:hypothetical protein